MTVKLDSITKIEPGLLNDLTKFEIVQPNGGKFNLTVIGGEVACIRSLSVAINASEPIYVFESFVSDQEMSQLEQQSNITLSEQVCDTIKYVCHELFNKRSLANLLGSTSNTQPLTF